VRCRFAHGIDQVGDGLGLRQIHTAVQKRPLRKFAGFGKPQPAVGFALYLGGLGRAFAEKSDYDVDTLLLYDAGQSPAQVARAVQSILKSGRSVRAEQSAPEGLRVRQTLRLGPDGAVPVTGGGGIC